MTEEVLNVDDLEQIKALIEAGMQEEAVNELQRLAARFKTPEQSLYDEVGVLTRGLHTSLISFASDERLKIITNVEMPSASERLSSIIEMTGNAANRTLDAVDASEALVKGISETVDSLLPTWEKLMRGHIDRYEFVSLCHQVDGLVHQTDKYAHKLSEQLNNILMAQDYQDLTGQMIQKVIKLVTEVEEKLLSFLTACGEQNPEISDNNKKQTSETSGLEPQGPATNSLKAAEGIAASQDDVDDLLASLGF